MRDKKGRDANKGWETWVQSLRFSLRDRVDTSWNYLTRVRKRDLFIGWGRSPRAGCKRGQGREALPHQLRVDLRTLTP